MVYRNIKFLLNKMLIKVSTLVAVLFVPLYLINPTFSFSLLLGVFFSYLSFYQFSYTQSTFLSRKNKGVFFISYLLRLGIYALPMAIGLFYKNYFNFLVILVSLFFFQAYYICIEFIRSLRKVRRQNK